MLPRLDDDELLAELDGVGDDEELLAELEGYMEEELTANLAKVELGRAVEMRSAPISLPAAGTKKVIRR